MVRAHPRGRFRRLLRSELANFALCKLKSEIDFALKKDQSEIPFKRHFGLKTLAMSTKVSYTA